MSADQNRPVITEADLVKVLSAFGALAPLVEREFWRLDPATRQAVDKALSLISRTPSFDGKYIVYVRRFRVVPTPEEGDR